MLRSTSRAASEVLLSTRRDPAVAHSYAALSRFFRQQDWRRPLHQVPRHQARLPSTWAIKRPTFTLYSARRYSTRPASESSVSGASKARIDPDDRPPGKDGHGAAEAPQATSTVVAKEKDSAAMHAHVSSFPRSLRRLALSLPSSGFRRPTKEELLSGTSSFFERLRIRFKWFTIRGFRRFRADDWSAFASWVLGGVGLWIVVGTTSFVSAVFLLLNSLQMQEWMAASLGSYLTSTSGLTIVFESAIVPKFSLKDSKLTFKNVYVSRGISDEQALQENLDHEEDETQRKRDNRIRRRVRRETGQALADLRSRDSLQSEARRTAAQAQKDGAVIRAEHDDGAPQYTHYHLAIDSVEVSLSLPRWLDGKGLVKAASVQGVRGVIDRSHIQHRPADANADHKRFRHKPQPGDFHLESLDVEDFLVTIYQPDNFRPYTFSVFSATLKSLRKQWFFFDMLSAESITGQVDNCLFSLHRPQTIGRTSQDDMKDNTWKRMSRFRVDGVPVDHLQTSKDTGPLSWIIAGKADLVADIRFPREPGDDVDLNSIIGDIVNNLDEALLRSPSSAEAERIPGRPVLAGGKPLEAPSVSLRRILGLQPGEAADPLQRIVSIDLDVRFRDVRAAIPLFTPDLSGVSNALVRPIVAFLNSNRTLIPIKCHVDIALEEFDGSWTTYDIGLLDAVSQQVYDALAHHVQESNARRAKTVGIWSLQKSAATILVALRQNLEHI